MQSWDACQAKRDHIPLFCAKVLLMTVKVLVARVYAPVSRSVFRKKTPLEPGHDGRQECKACHPVVKTPRVKAWVRDVTQWDMVMAHVIFQGMDRGAPGCSKARPLVGTLSADPAPLTEARAWDSPGSVGQGDIGEGGVDHLDLDHRTRPSVQQIPYRGSHSEASTSGGGILQACTLVAST